MPSFYDQLLAAGGYNPSGGQLDNSWLSLSNLGNPGGEGSGFTNDYQRLFGGPDVWETARQFGYTGPSPNDSQPSGDSSGPTADWHGALQDWMRTSGYNYGIQPTENGGQVNAWFDPSGNMIDGTRREFAAPNDNTFWTGALLAGGLAGGAAAGAFGGGAGAGAELSGMDLAADAALGSGNNIATAASQLGAGAGVGATSFPVAAGDVATTQLAPSGLQQLANVSYTAPAVPASTAISGSAGAAGAAADPISAYLTTGASEGSTVGSAITGSGGAAGAVGSGTTASNLQWLSTIGNGVGSAVGGVGGRSLVDILAGLYGLKLANDARSASDPFAPYRAGYAQQLQQLEANPSLITTRPGYQAGIEATQRNNAARGYAGSGNETAVLSRYTGDFFNNELSRLSGLAGANVTPGNGQFQAANLAGQGLASIGYGLAPYLSGGPR